MGNVLAFPASRQRVGSQPPAPTWRDPEEFDRLSVEIGRLLALRAENASLQHEYAQIRHACERAGLMAEWLDNFVRVRLCVPSTSGLTAEQLAQVMPELRTMVTKVDAFDSDLRAITHALRTMFAQQVLGRGTPWTPWIKRACGRSGKRIDKYARHVVWQALRDEVMVDATRATEGGDHA